MSEKTPELVHISLAYLFNERGEVLLARRPHDKMFGGLWEFPGGKHEKNESANEALIRELKEELSIETEAVESLRTYRYVVGDETTLCVHPIVVKRISGNLELKEHSALAWASIQTLLQYELAPPDYEAVAILERHLRPKPQ